MQLFSLLRLVIPDLLSRSAIDYQELFCLRYCETSGRQFAYLWAKGPGVGFFDTLWRVLHYTPFFVLTFSDGDRVREFSLESGMLSTTMVDPEAILAKRDRLVVYNI